MSWEQISNDVVFTAFFVATKVGKTGLADVTVDVYRNGSIIVTAAAATEEGGGAYRYTLASASVTVPGRYVAIFKTADGTVDQQHVPSLMLVGLAGVESLDAPVSGVPAATYALFGAATVTVTSTVASDGTSLSLVRGDDYVEAQSRQITFSSTQWPDLTDADPIVMTIRRRKEAFGGGSDPVLLVREDTITSRDVGGSPQVVVFELQSDIGMLLAPNSGDTNALLPGDSTGKYAVEATLVTGEIITLVTGIVSVVEDQTRP